MKKNVNPRAMAIQKRFFDALAVLIDNKTITGLKGFCADNHLNRIKYQRIKTSMNAESDEPYKYIDIDALAALCDKGISPAWLLTGKGKMLKRTTK